MNLYLIGYRGSGKSSVAPLLAEAIGWEVFDSDQEIEILTGQTISEIFSTDGEAVFREWETTVIQAVSHLGDRVVSLGGGAPISKTNREIIKSTGKTVWLQAPPSVLWSRISKDERSSVTRPALSAHGGLEEVLSILEERAPVYEACADYTIDTSQMSPSEIADKIANWWVPVD